MEQVLITFLKYFLIALLIWNLIAFGLMGYDKARAKNDEWRVPERVLFLFSFCFGGIGIFAGMKVFHHKTQHMSFKILVPLGIVIDIAIAAGIAYLVMRN